MDFEEMVRRAAGHAPYPYQARLAAEGLPEVLCVPTGAGKTLAATLPWLYRRTADPAGTPRWLVVVLPQRTLVEQTVTAVRGWLGNLKNDTPVHVLMGGEEADDREWRVDPARQRIFVGTQDMVLSRLLARGYAERPSCWPTTFGLFNSGVQFVFDEVQLLGPGLPTSVQLQAFRESMGTAQPTRTMWMSATVDDRRLSTVDHPGPRDTMTLDRDDRVGALARRLDATRTVDRLEVTDDRRRYPRELAARVVAAHRPGTRTLVVLNTVERAVEVFDAVAAARPAADAVLLHSRFRPADRLAQTERALAEPGPGGLIVVSTQVLEAGVDVTSHTLVTETAPWSSVVQRAGRCNRDGLAADARLWWTPPPVGREAALPYSDIDLDATVAALTELAGRAVTSVELAAAAPDSTPPVHPVLRRRDLLGLFDTAPDLAGNDVDVGQFIRDADERTAFLAWREPAEDGPAAARAELCPAPVAAVRDLVDRARVLDRDTGRWRRARRADLRPGVVVLLDAEAGGYLSDRGFSPASAVPVEPVVPAEPEAAEALDRDPLSVGTARWVPLAEHLADTRRDAEAILDEFGHLPGLAQAQREAVVLGAWYHDLGKAHPVFQASLRAAAPEHPTPDDGPQAKSPSRVPLRHRPPHFCHELVSALLLADEELGLLAGVTEAHLVTYLAQAHHGRVRVTVRARPDEPVGRLLGVTDGDRTLAVDGFLPDHTVSLTRTGFGAGSLTSRALALRDRADLGPFRLAFCEALVIAADWRSSRRYDEEAR